MNYEKKYKDVQKWIASIYTKLNYIHQIEAEALFPALMERKGERIRETLIEYIKHWQKGYSKWNSDKDFCKDAIAWLEREKPVTFSFEEGEKIRKALLKLVHDTTRDELLDNYEVHKEKALEWLEKQGKQKPTWSEDDDKMMYYTNEFLKYHENSDPTATSCIKWLKSLKSQNSNEKSN